jgi:hypothetical protein
VQQTGGSLTPTLQITKFDPTNRKVYANTVRLAHNIRHTTCTLTTLGLRVRSSGRNGSENAFSINN